MRRFVLMALWVALVVAPALAQPATTGSASGNLTVDGKTIPLRYAYAVAVDDVEGAGLMSGPTKYQVIVLSNSALPLSSVGNRNAPFGERHSPGQMMAALEQAPADKIYGIVLRVDSAKRTLLHTEFLYPGKDTISMSIVGEIVPDRLTGLKTAGGKLSGTAFLPGVQETHLDKGPKKYQYRATFSAPLLSEPRVTAKLEGKEALASPPVQTIRDYMAAAQKGDVEALRRLTAATHQAYLKNPKVIEYLRQGDMSKLTEQVKRVVVRGDTATVVCVNEEPNYSQVLMQLTREGGAWKLCWP